MAYKLAPRHPKRWIVYFGQFNMSCVTYRIGKNPFWNPRRNNPNVIQIHCSQSIPPRPPISALAVQSDEQIYKAFICVVSGAKMVLRGVLQAEYRFGQCSAAIEGSRLYLEHHPNPSFPIHPFPPSQGPAHCAEQ